MERARARKSQGAGEHKAGGVERRDGQDIKRQGGGRQGANVESYGGEVKRAGSV